MSREISTFKTRGFTTIKRRALYGNMFSFSSFYPASGHTSCLGYTSTIRLSSHSVTGKVMAVSEADAIKDLTGEEVEDLKETFRTFDKVCPSAARPKNTSGERGRKIMNAPKKY